MDSDDLFRMRNGQLGKDHRVEKLEDGEIRTDAEDKREKHRCGQSRSAAKLPQRMAEITCQVLKIQRYAQRIDAVLAMWGLDHPDGSMLLARREYVYRRRSGGGGLSSLRSILGSNPEPLFEMEEQPIGLWNIQVE